MKIKIEQTTAKQITEQLARDAPDHIRAGYLVGSIEEGEIIVDGVYVPDQKSDKTGTVIGLEEQLSAFQAIKSDEKKVIGFVQYNGHFPAFESATTRKSREGLARRTGIPNLGVVVNSKKECAVYQ